MASTTATTSTTPTSTLTAAGSSAPAVATVAMTSTTTELASSSTPGTTVPAAPATSPATTVPGGTLAGTPSSAASGASAAPPATTSTTPTSTLTAAGSSAPAVATVSVTSTTTAGASSSTPGTTVPAAPATSPAITVPGGTPAGTSGSAASGASAAPPATTATTSATPTSTLTAAGSSAPAVATVSMTSTTTAGASSSTPGTTVPAAPVTSPATTVPAGTLAGTPGSADPGASAAPPTTTAQRLDNVGYLRWIKVGRGLLRLKVILTKPTERVVNALHGRITATVMHSVQMTCSVADMTSAFAAMISLIQDSKLSADPDIDAAQEIKSLEEIRDAAIDIMTEDEVKVWQDLIKSLQQHDSQIDIHDTQLDTVTTDLATLSTELATLKSQGLDQAIKDFLTANPDLLSRLNSHEQTMKQLSELQQRVRVQQRNITPLRSTSNAQTGRVDMEKLEEHPSTKNSDEVLKELCGELKDTYLRECSGVQPIPWVERTLPLQKVFIPVTLRRSTQGNYRQRQEGERSVEMDDIFLPHQTKSPQTESPQTESPQTEQTESPQTKSPRPRRIRVEGTPGKGKSIFCQRLAYSWAQGVEASSSESSASTSAPFHASTGSHTGARSTSQIGHPPLPTRTRPEPLGGAHSQTSRVPEEGGLSPIAGFALVLLLIVRNLVVGDLSDNLLALLVGESWRTRQEELRTCLANNCKQVLVILDGYDEAEVPNKDILTNFLESKSMKGCTFLVTSRPGFCKFPFDASFDLEGFDRHKWVTYVNRFMEVVKGVPNHPCVAVLLHRLEYPGIIGDLCQTPLFLVLVCVLSGREGNALPDTRTELYEQFLNFLHRQAAKRHGFDSDYMSSLQRIAFALLKDKTTDISIATIEQHSATHPSTPGPSTVKHDQPPTARADVTLRVLCQIGFLIQNDKLKGLAEVASGSFIHQSFMDYFAAKHFVTIPKDQRETFIAENNMLHNVFVHVAGLAAGRGELWGELFDGWLSARGAQRFDPSDPVSETSRMSVLTWDNHALMHDVPFSWLAESTNVCSASLALLTHGQLEAVCLTERCTESCVRGVRTLCEALSGVQAAPAAHPLYLGLYNCEQFGVGVVLDVLKQVGLTHGAVDCVVLESGWLGKPSWTVSDCKSLAALPAYMQLKRIYLGVCDIRAMDALSHGFTCTHALQWLIVWCSHSSLASGLGVHSQHLTEFMRNIRSLSNIQRIELLDGMCEVSVEAERNLRDWGAGRGVKVVVKSWQGGRWRW